MLINDVIAQRGVSVPPKYNDVIYEQPLNKKSNNNQHNENNNGYGSNDKGSGPNDNRSGSTSIDPTIMHQDPTTMDTKSIDAKTLEIIFSWPLGVGKRMNPKCPQ